MACRRSQPQQHGQQKPPPPSSAGAKRPPKHAGQQETQQQPHRSQGGAQPAVFSTAAAEEHQLPSNIIGGTSYTTPATCNHYGQDVSGLPTTPMPSYLFVHTLSRPFGQPRRAHLQIIPRKSGSCLSIQFSSKRGLRTSRRTSTFNRFTCCCRYLL